MVADLSQPNWGEGASPDLSTLPGATKAASDARKPAKPRTNNGRRSFTPPAEARQANASDADDSIGPDGQAPVAPVEPPPEPTIDDLRDAIRSSTDCDFAPVVETLQKSLTGYPPSSREGTRLLTLHFRSTFQTARALVAALDLLRNLKV